MKKRYVINLGPKLDSDLGRIAKELAVSKAEVLRRALTLFSHAVDADTVKLITKNGEQTVLLK